MHLDQALVKVLHILVLAASVLAKRHDVAYKLIGSDNGDFYIGLISLGNADNFRIIMGVIHHNSSTVRLDYLIYKKSYRLSPLDKRFIEKVEDAKEYCF